MSKLIVNRPAKPHTTTLESLLIAKLGGKREYGAFLDKLKRTTKKRGR